MPRRTSPEAIGGLTASAGATAAFAVVHSVFPSVPFPPVAMAQAFVRLPPGRVAEFFIGILGHWALRLTVLGACIAFVASGYLLGLATPWIRRRLGATAATGGMCSLLPLWAAIVLLSPRLPGSAGRPWYALVTLLVIAGCGAAGGVVAERLEQAAGEPSTPGNRSRRAFLAGAAVGGAGIALGLADPARLFRRPDPGEQPLELANLRPASIPPSSTEDSAFDDIPGLTPEITPLADFYTVNEEIIRPAIDPVAWALSIGGLVGSPVRLSYDELLRMPAVERYQTMLCISNPVGGDIISTQRFAGIPLPVLIHRAGGLGHNAEEVVFRAESGYSDSMPVAQAMSEETLIVIGMGGHVLPRAHGFPARLLGIGNYGMKNPKWLVEISAVGSPYDGYWERRGWSKPAVIRTMSRIDVPHDGETVRGAVTIAGIAFAGDRGIERVDVSTDGGVRWEPATLKRALSPSAWRLWRYRWEPPAPGTYELVVRAVDGTGTVQTAGEAPPFPAGASGYHTRTITVA